MNHTQIFNCTEFFRYRESLADVGLLKCLMTRYWNKKGFILNTIFSATLSQQKITRPVFGSA